MKYIKLLLIVTCLAGLTACSDDDNTFNVNTSEAIVQFSKKSISVKESVKSINLPIDITGTDRNGFIKIKAEVKSNPVDFDLYNEVMVTSFDFIVPADRQSVNLEVGLNVETLNMERGRNISFQITHVEGATLGANTDCTINIIEQNVAEGIYEISGVSPFDNEKSYGAIRFSAEDESFDNMYIDIGFGRKGRVIFREIVADTEYDITIQPFPYLGQYTEGKNTYDVYMSFGRYNAETKKFTVDRNATIRGKFLRKVENGKQTVTITLRDGFGLGHITEDDDFEWFLYDCYKAGAVLTKTEQ